MCDRCERNARARDAAETLRPPTSAATDRGCTLCGKASCLGADCVAKETARDAEVRIYGPLAQFRPETLLLSGLLLSAALERTNPPAPRSAPSRN